MLNGWKAGLLCAGRGVIRMAEGGEVDETTAAVAEFAGVDPSSLSGDTWQQVTELFFPLMRKLALNLVICAVIFIIGRRVIKAILKALDKTTERTKVDVGVAKFLHSLIQWLLYLLLIFMMAGQLGVNTASIFTVLGAAGLAIAMSLQGSLSNVAGGILILTMRPFRVGDYISTSFGDGTVNMIGTVYTTITTIDNRVITIPNGVLSNSAVTNITANPERRLDLLFSIDYGADIRKAREVIEGVISANPDVEQDREKLVFVDNLADSAVNMGVIVWVKTPRFIFAKRALTEDIKIALDEAGIKIPFPQMDVHLDGNV